MEVILDTNALSAIADGRPSLAPLLQRITAMYVPAIVLGEFRFGIQASRHRQVYENWLTGFLPASAILPADGRTAAAYARVRQELKDKGRPIPWHDVWIAACARQYNHPLLSNDTHFDYVPSLKRLGW